MKKLIALIFAIVCVFGFSACSSEDITGTIKFYTESTLERTEPVLANFVELSKDQIKEIQKVLNGVKSWTDDSVVDRLTYYFDGEFQLSDSGYLYYFSYEYNVIYYDHYFAVVTEEQMQSIKNMDDT